MTVGALVDRAVADWLQPPDELWPSTTLDGLVTLSATSWTVDLDALTAEETSLLAVGTLVEAESESALITARDGAVLTVRRGIRGTTAAAHADGTEVLIQPTWTRPAIFDAVRESIVRLSPPLFTSNIVEVDVDGDGWADLPSGVIHGTSFRYAAGAARHRVVFREVVGPVLTSVTADAATDVFTATAHGLSDGDEVRFSGTTAPGGVTFDTSFFVVTAAADTFQVSETSGGSAVDVTSVGDTVKVRKVSDTTLAKRLYAPLAATRNGWFEYRGKLGYADTEGDTLASLGVADGWADVVIVGAVAKLIAGRALSDSQMRYVSEQLRTEGYPVETPSRIRDSLLRYQQFLLREASAGLISEHPTDVLIENLL